MSSFANGGAGRGSDGGAGRGGNRGGGRPGRGRGRGGRRGGRGGRGRGRGGQRQDIQPISTPTGMGPMDVSRPATPVASSAAATFVSSTTMSYLTDSRFSDLPISNEAKRGIREDLGYETMTQVQVAAIGTCLAGEDVLAKAKTGTGKTLAFMIPAFEKIIKVPKARRSGISVLIISPTRELAQQIMTEGKAMLN
ncbi:unnamed protein product [Chrysoparadoxa australica]